LFWLKVSVLGKLMKKVLGIILLFSASLSWAQARIEDGGHEIQLWTGGGHSVSGGTSDTGVWNVGLRYGWILTRPHGPGFFKEDSNTRWMQCRYFCIPACQHGVRSRFNP